MGFRTKLILSYVFLIALVTGCFYFYFNHTLQTGMIEESRANRVSQTQLARLLVMSVGRGCKSVLMDEGSAEVGKDMGPLVVIGLFDV